MYRRFTIENYKRLRAVAIEDCARVNLITGENNTGKTSVLEALDFHSGGTNFAGLLRLPAQRGGLGAYHAETFLDNHFVFTHSNIVERVQFYGETHGSAAQQWTVTLDALEASPERLNAALRELAPILEPYLVRSSGQLSLRDIQLIEVRRRTGLQEELLYYATNLEQRLIIETRVWQVMQPTVMISAQEIASAYTFADRYSMAYKAGYRDTLLHTLQFVEPRLRDIELLLHNHEIMLHGDIGLGRPLPLALMGQGLERIVRLVLALMTTPGGVVLVDEIEAGLHHTTLEAVWKALYTIAHTHEVQLFATTHSYECVQAAYAAFDDINSSDLRLYRLEMNRTGDLGVITYDRDVLGTAFAMNAEVR